MGLEEVKVDEGGRLMEGLRGGDAWHLVCNLWRLCVGTVEQICIIMIVGC